MGLRRDQQAVLAQIDADLERADPELARRLRSMLGPARRRGAVRRPPRSVVMLAAVLAAAAVFLATMIILMMPQPCRARPPTTGGPSTPAASGPSTPARGPGATRSGDPTVLMRPAPARPAVLRADP